LLRALSSQEDYYEQYGWNSD
jgi:hypothetical protein